MAKKSSQFNKKHPDKKTSNTGRTSRSQARTRVSLSKSIGKIRKSEDETPIVAIQKIHLFRKQKAFLSKQAIVFEKKVNSVKDQVKDLEKKIKAQRALAVDLVEGLEKGKDYIEETVNTTRRSKPDKTISQKPRGIFKLRF